MSSRPGTLRSVSAGPTTRLYCGRTGLSGIPIRWTSRRRSIDVIEAELARLSTSMCSGRGRAKSGPCIGLPSWALSDVAAPASGAGGGKLTRARAADGRGGVSSGAVSEAAPSGWGRPEYLLAPPVFATRLVYIATIILLPSLLVDRGLPPEAVGALVGAYGYAAIVMDLTAGALADRFAPARLAALGSGGVLAAVALVGTAGSVPALAAGRVLHGLSMGLFRPAAS